MLQALPAQHTLVAGTLRLTVLPIQAADETPEDAFDAAVTLAGATERPTRSIARLPRNSRLLVPCDDLVVTADELPRRREILDEIRGGPKGLPWYVLPKPEHVETILRFGRALRQRTGMTRVLVHCNAGVSRSPAAALILAVDAVGPDRAETAVSALFEALPHSSPQLWLVADADEILGCGGRLLASVQRRAPAADRVPAPETIFA